MKLWDFQQKIVDKTISFVKDSQAQAGVVIAPVGSGKSVMIAAIAKQLNTHILVLQPSKELLEQNYSKFIAVGGEASICSASLQEKSVGKVTFATLGTVKSFLGKLNKVQVVIVDECHADYSFEENGMFRKFITALSPRKVIGFTATPVRNDAYTDGMPGTFGFVVPNFITQCKHTFFTEVIHIVQVKEMVQGAYWSPLHYHSINHEGIKELGTCVKVDYDLKQVDTVLNKYNIPTGACNKIKAMTLEGCKRILVFSTTVSMAHMMADELLKRGITAEVVDGAMPMKHRTLVVERFKSGETSVVINYGTLTTGFDLPLLDAVVLLRPTPTNSISLYYQMVGRVVRKGEGKEVAHIYDFGGNIKRFCPVENIEIKQNNGTYNIVAKDITLTGLPAGVNIPEVVYREAKAIASKKVSPVFTDATLKFGKYKGKKLKEIPASYLVFMLTQSDFKSGEHQSYILPFVVMILNRIKIVNSYTYASSKKKR